MVWTVDRRLMLGLLAFWGARELGCSSGAMATGQDELALGLEIEASQGGGQEDDVALLGAELRESLLPVVTPPEQDMPEWEPLQSPPLDPEQPFAAETGGILEPRSTHEESEPSLIEAVVSVPATEPTTSMEDGGAEANSSEMEGVAVAKDVVAQVPGTVEPILEPSIENASNPLELPANPTLAGAEVAVEVEVASLPQIAAPANLETIGFEKVDIAGTPGSRRWTSQANAAGDLEQLGLSQDWHVAPGVTTTASQSLHTAGALEGAAISGLELRGERSIATHTSLTAGYALAQDLSGRAEAGLLQQRSLGLKHRWQLMPKMFVEFDYERVWGRGLVAELEQSSLSSLGFDLEREEKPGDSGEWGGQALRWPDSLKPMSTSRIANRAGNRVSVYVNYLPGPDWQVQGRLQNRNEGDRSRTQMTAALRGQLSPRWYGSLDGEQTYATDPKVEGLGPTTHLRLGAMYRPVASPHHGVGAAPRAAAHSAWAMQLRYEYRRNLDLSRDEAESVSDQGFGSATHLAGAEFSYAPASRWQLRSQLALRHRSLYAMEDPEDEGMAVLAQQQVSYRVGPRLKLRGDVRSRSHLGGEGSQAALSMEAAYGVTRYLNLVLGYGMGKGRDRDFLQRGFTDGPYVRLKLR